MQDTIIRVSQPFKDRPAYTSETIINLYKKLYDDSFTACIQVPRDHNERFPDPE